MEAYKSNHKKSISRALYSAAISLWLVILQKGKFNALAAASSSCPSPITTYVHFRPNLVTILSKQLSLPGRKNLCK